MLVSEKWLLRITQVLLLAAIAIVPFVRVNELYFPFVSGKAYVFRMLVAAAFFFWIWLLLIGKEYRPNFRNILVAAVVVFFLTQVVASFFGVDPLYSFFGSIERHDGVLQYGFWALYFLMFLSVFREARDWKIFFSVFVGVALLLSAYSFFNHESQLQLYGIFGNPAYFAAFLVFAIGFSLIVFERKFFFPGPLHYAFLAAAGLLLIALVFTQVRGVYVAIAGGMFLFSTLCILFLRKEQKKLALSAGAALLIGVVPLGVLFVAKDTEFVQRTRLLWRITEVAEFWESDSVRERVLNWNIALKAFREKPLFGYGPENFATAANKYYDYRIGKGEPWFDRAHNQPLDTLATSGVMGFSAYLFLLGAATFLIFQIAKREKLLGFLLASVFLAYFLQGFFLFDLLAVYLGLFPLLAFLLWQYTALYKNKEEHVEVGESATTPDGRRGANLFTLMLVGVISLGVMYASAFMPWKASAAALQFYAHSETGRFKESLVPAKEAFLIKSPYTTWEVRKRIGWQLEQVLEEYQPSEESNQEHREELRELYDVMVPELERFIEARPYDPQMYYVLARIYRFGAEKLGKDGLHLAAATLKKAFQHSDLRVEYYNEYANVLLAQGKVEEAEQSVRDYIARVNFSETFPFVTLGHFYFAAGKYEQALLQYEKAREAGYSFVETVPGYYRYIYVAEAVGDYRAIVDMAKLFLERWGPDADTYFNTAVGYLHLGDKETGREFFLKARELKPEYEEYNSFFLE